MKKDSLDLPVEEELKIKIGSDQEPSLNRSRYAGEVRNFFLRNQRHYLPVKSRIVRPEFFNIETPFTQQSVAESGRVYYDTSYLKLTFNDPKVECRVKSKESNGDGIFYVQAIKIGRGKERVEIEKAVRYPKPQLNILKTKKRIHQFAAICDALGQEFNFQNFPLVPLVCVFSSSWKLLYHPGGNKKVRVEAKIDCFSSITAIDLLDGASPLDSYEVELELEHNETGKEFKLEQERTYLCEEFNEEFSGDTEKKILTPTDDSKPSAAFERVKKYIQDKRFQEAIPKIRMYMTPQTFQAEWASALALG